MKKQKAKKLKATSSRAASFVKYLLFVVLCISILGLWRTGQVEEKVQWLIFLKSVRSVTGEWLSQTYNVRVNFLEEEPLKKNIPDSIGINFGDAIINSSYVEVALNPTTGDMIQRFYATPAVAAGLLKDASVPTSDEEIGIDFVQGKGHYIYAKTGGQTKESLQQFLQGEPWEIGVALHLPGQVDRPPTTQSVVSKFRNEVRAKYNQEIEAPMQAVTSLRRSMYLGFLAIPVWFLFVVSQNWLANMERLRQRVHTSFWASPKLASSAVGATPAPVATPIIPKALAKEVANKPSLLKPAAFETKAEAEAKVTRGKPKEYFDFTRCSHRFDNLWQRFEKAGKLYGENIGKASGHKAIADWEYRCGEYLEALRHMQIAVEYLESAS